MLLGGPMPFDAKDLAARLYNRIYPREIFEKFLNDASCEGLIGDMCEHCRSTANVIMGSQWICGYCGYLNEGPYTQGKRRIYARPNMGMPFESFIRLTKDEKNTNMYIVVEKA